MTESDPLVMENKASASLEAWRLVRSMLDNMTKMIQEDAETEIELLEGLRVLARATALCSELSIDVDYECPYFFSMNTRMRYIGGPNPDGEYHLGMIDGERRYRIRGLRGTACYLGFQVLAGRGLMPRRMAGYVSDRDLRLHADGSFGIVLAREEPAPEQLGSATWVPIPGDASAIVVRQYIADRAVEEPASYNIEALDSLGPPLPPTNEMVASQLTAMAWTIAKLTTLHRTIMPQLVGDPNRLVTTEAARLGSENTTPDNLYMIGTFRLLPDEALVIDAAPPKTRYWSLTLENIWHECFDVGRRRTSITHAAAVRRPDDRVRFVIAGCDPGVPNWLDTGGRHRGFMTFRWLDNPSPPEVETRVVPTANVAGLA
ncbi:MAG TPA: DUF1214 domain-containing protein [Myxococcota bacterium]|nr:DUF1214 domain-containing protein [Myxococcota bacterium]